MSIKIKGIRWTVLKSEHRTFARQKFREEYKGLNTDRSLRWV